MNRDLRAALCSPPIVSTDGVLNPLYFQSKPGQYWSVEDQEQLWKGIKACGIGREDLIRARFLPEKSLHELQLRTCLLVGAHDLTTAQGVKSRAKVEAMRLENERRGIAEDRWQYGLYLNKARPS